MASRWLLASKRGEGVERALRLSKETQTGSPSPSAWFPLGSGRGTEQAPKALKNNGAAGRANEMKDGCERTPNSQDRLGAHRLSDSIMNSTGNPDLAYGLTIEASATCLTSKPY
jgi:hypothetical protein